MSTRQSRSSNIERQAITEQVNLYDLDVLQRELDELNYTMALDGDDTSPMSLKAYESLSQPRGGYRIN
ncbi:hypothetical protein HYT24_00085 [Candidatus Pacearchaeota archaeon]|nr:hypothetical protein [Candidatus Pacearchaeota archaeon]